jgi:hypothetical protein
MIKIGDVVKLRPSIFEDDFRNSKTEWSNKFMYEDTFESVSLWFDKLGQEGDMARTIFGSTESRIIRIENSEDGQPFVVVTDLFRIIFPEALRRKELTVRKYNEKNYKQFKSDRELIDSLESFEKEYLNRVFSILERENNKMDMYKLHFHLMKHEGKWQNAC